jgi:hypothetical protein
VDADGAVGRGFALSSVSAINAELYKHTVSAINSIRAPECGTLAAMFASQDGG